MQQSAIDPEIGDELLPEDAPIDTLAYSGGVVVDGGGYKRVFLSGIVSDEPLNGLEAQSTAIFDKIDHYLKSEGGDINDVVRLEIFFEQPHLSMDKTIALHEIRHEYFDPPYPASTVVEVTNLVRNDRILEVQADAVIPVWGDGERSGTN